MSETKKRVQMDFSRPAYMRAVEIQREMGATTFAGVIRQALLLLDWFVTFRKEGYVLHMRGPQGEIVDAPDLDNTR